MITLSAEQKRGLDLLEQVRNVGGVGVLMGEAGSGKSTGLNVFRSQFPQTVVTAPTGLAAINVSGVTIDRFMGWRLGETKVKNLSKVSKRKLMASGVMVIDEMSMLRADRVDRLDRDLRTTFQTDEPFGGIGIYFIGDPFQLEPVVSKSDPSEHKAWTEAGYASPYFFDAKVWGRVKPEFVRLTKIFRQEGDDRFKDALNLIRLGDPCGLELVNTRARRIPAIGSIKLCFTNAVADEINRREYGYLASEEKVYTASSFGRVEREYPSPATLKLKIGSRVISTANEKSFPDDPVFINGDLGTVVGFGDEGPVVLFDRGFQLEMKPYMWETAATKSEGQSALIQADDDSGWFCQIPLKLAWAISVHKSQGMTLDKVHIMAGDAPAFACGQLYVALSRCRTLELMSIDRALTERDVKVSRRVQDWYKGVVGQAVAA